jgi:hypothetical protein
MEYIFIDSAARLEAGEDFEKIMNDTHNSLVKHFRKYGYMQRDSETYSEFESAINQALEFLDKDALHTITEVIENMKYSDSTIFEDFRTETISAFKKLEESMRYIRENESKLSEEIKAADESSPTKDDDKKMSISELKELLEKIEAKYPKNKTFDREALRAKLLKELSKLPKPRKFTDPGESKELNKIQKLFEDSEPKKIYNGIHRLIQGKPLIVNQLYIKPGCITFLIESFAMTNELPIVKKQASEKNVLDALKIGLLKAQIDGRKFVTPDDLKLAIRVVLIRNITIKKFEETKKIEIKDLVECFPLNTIPVPYIKNEELK